MDGLTDNFAGYEQRDAHEFLSDLIDLLHEELSRAVDVDVNTNAKSVKEAGGGGNLEPERFLLISVSALRHVPLC